MHSERRLRSAAAMFFDTWSSLGRTALAGAIAYVALVTFLRISGKRTLAKMNAFDFVVTVALGSTLSSILTSRNVPIANGLLALALLIALQYAVAWLTVRAPWFERVVKSRPAAVFAKKEFDEEAMRCERVARDEVLMAIRRAGIHDLDRVFMVVLETDGSLNVLGHPEERPARASVEDVSGGVDYD
jgi:uncharacterized membrane protein YcaP (DUF421 family)